MSYRIALVGNPNTGKTTLFNRLCGARAKTSNFPGTTTAARIGRATLADGAGPVEPRSSTCPASIGSACRRPNRTICRDVLAGRGPVPQARRRRGRRRRVQPDAQPGARRRAARLRRAGRRRAEHGRPRAAARADARRRRRCRRELGCPVVPIVARRGEAVDRLHGGRRRRADARRVAHAARPRRPTQALEAWADKAVARQRQPASARAATR